MNDFVIRINKRYLIIFVLISSLYFAFTHNVKNANASANPSGLTGQYGCLMNRNTSAYTTLWTGHSGAEGTNAMVYLDYSNNTMSSALTAHPNYNSVNVTTIIRKYTATFVETVYVGVKNTYKTEFNMLNDDGTAFGIMTFYTIPVNGGKTILFTSQEDGLSKGAWSGVCQQI
jgi:hypothetical protein